MSRTKHRHHQQQDSTETINIQIHVLPPMIDIEIMIIQELLNNPHTINLQEMHLQNQ
jgi:hypothetical protein